MAAACGVLLRFCLVFPCSVCPPVVEEETPIPWAACRCRFHPLLRSCFPVNPPPRSTSRSTVKVPLETSRSPRRDYQQARRRPSSRPVLRGAAAAPSLPPLQPPQRLLCP